MNLIFLIGVIIILILISHIIDRFIPFVPEALIQVVVGIVCAVVLMIFFKDNNFISKIINGSDFLISNEVFFALFIAPILFREAEQADVLAMNSVRKEILFMAFLLVFITCFGVGGLYHVFFPENALASGFALGAILGPIDAVAIFAFVKMMNIKNASLHIIRGEGLINDASGIIAFQFAIIFLLSGEFSAVNAVKDLFILVITGIAIGLVFGFLKNVIMAMFRRFRIRNFPINILLEISIPFMSYACAEILGTSGIITAVTAGCISSLRRLDASIFEARLKIMKNNIWDLIIYVLNALIFIFLGISLPNIIVRLKSDGFFDDIRVFFIPVLITIVVYVIRFIFIHVFISKFKKSEIKNSVFLTASGPKGAVSLVIAFTLPSAVLLPSGTIYNERPLLLFMAGVTILLSLIFSAILLPLLTDKDMEEKNDRKIKTIRIIKKVIKELSLKCPNVEIFDVIIYYKKQIESIEGGIPNKKIREDMKVLGEVYHKLIKAELLHYLQQKYITKNEWDVLYKILNLEIEYISKKKISDEYILTDHEKTLMNPKKIMNVYWDISADVFDKIRKKYPEVCATALDAFFHFTINLSGQIFEVFYGQRIHQSFRESYIVDVLNAFDTERKIILASEEKGVISSWHADQMRIRISEIEKFIIEEKDNTQMIRILGNRLKKGINTVDGGKKK